MASHPRTRMYEKGRTVRSFDDLLTLCKDPKARFIIEATWPRFRNPRTGQALTGVFMLNQQIRAVNHWIQYGNVFVAEPKGTQPELEGLDETF